MGRGREAEGESPEERLVAIDKAEQALMLDVMSSGMMVSWEELDEVWPWSRVLEAHDAVTRARYYQAHPIAYLHSTYISANLKRGRRRPKPNELMLPTIIPPEVMYSPQAEAVYSDGIVEAFTLARSLGFTGNAHLAAFGTEELRASGWSPEAGREV